MSKPPKQQPVTGNGIIIICAARIDSTSATGEIGGMRQDLTELMANRDIHHRVVVVVCLLLSLGVNTKSGLSHLFMGECPGIKQRQDKTPFVFLRLSQCLLFHIFVFHCGLLSVPDCGKLVTT